MIEQITIHFGKKTSGGFQYDSTSHYLLVADAAADQIWFPVVADRLPPQTTRVVVWVRHGEPTVKVGAYWPLEWSIGRRRDRSDGESFEVVIDPELAARKKIEAREFFELQLAVLLDEGWSLEQAQKIAIAAGATWAVDAARWVIQCLGDERWASARCDAMMTLIDGVIANGCRNGWQRAKAAFDAGGFPLPDWVTSRNALLRLLRGARAAILAGI